MKSLDMIKVRPLEEKVRNADFVLRPMTKFGRYFKKN
jgi:hypothetical protein